MLFTTKLFIKCEQEKVNETTSTVLENIVSQIISQNFSKIGLNPKELELLHVNFAKFLRTSFYRTLLVVASEIRKYFSKTGKTRKSNVAKSRETKYCRRKRLWKLRHFPRDNYFLQQFLPWKVMCPFFRKKKWLWFWVRLLKTELCKFQKTSIKFSKKLQNHF